MDTKNRVYSLIESAPEDYAGAPFIAFAADRTECSKCSPNGIPVSEESRKQLRRSNMYPVVNIDPELEKLRWMLG